MIVYRCDISGKEIPLERVNHCNAHKQEFCKKFPDAGPAVEQAFYWLDEYDEQVDAYWQDRVEVLRQQYDLMNRTLANHKKSFFKDARKGSLKAVK